MRRILGIVCLVIGISLLGWVAYNLFVELQPEAEGRSPYSAIMFSAVMIYIGLQWIRNHTISELPSWWRCTRPRSVVEASYRSRVHDRFGGTGVP